MVDTDVRSDLVQVACPTLITHADHDPLMPVACARLMADAISSSTLKLLAADDHVVVVTRPDEGPFSRPQCGQLDERRQRPWSEKQAATTSTPRADLDTQAGRGRWVAMRMPTLDTAKGTR